MNAVRGDKNEGKFSICSKETVLAFPAHKMKLTIAKHAMEKNEGFPHIPQKYL